MNAAKKEHNYDIIIPIYKPGENFERVLDLLKKQEPAPSKIILLETLDDGEEPAVYADCEVVPVRKEEFDHASTRRLGVSYSRSDAFIFMTQDAVPQDTKLCARLLDGLYAWETELSPAQKKDRDIADYARDYRRSAGDNTFATGPCPEDVLRALRAQDEKKKQRTRIESGPAINSAVDMDPDTSSWDNVPQGEYVRLIRENERRTGSFCALPNGRIAMCYARQIAREDSSEMEKFSRKFNYPAKSFTKSIADVPELGIKAFFASNVCCAYNRDLYESVMGFEPHAIFNEDMLYAAKAMKQGYRVAYAANAKVVHSHNYTAMEQFHRMFDNGMSQAMHPEVFAGIASEGEGKRLVKETAAHLMEEGHPLQVISLLWQSAFKYLGFRMGRKYKKYSYRKLRRLALNKTYIDRHFCSSTGRDVPSEAKTTGRDVPSRLK